MVAGGKLALASAAPGYFKKESEPVITGDRKVASISCIAFCHPFHGLHNIFVHNRGCARCAGLPLPFIFYPLARAQNSAGVRPRIRKINYNLPQSLGHMCSTIHPGAPAPGFHPAEPDFIRPRGRNSLSTAPEVRPFHIHSRARKRRHFSACSEAFSIFLCHFAS